MGRIILFILLLGTVVTLPIRASESFKVKNLKEELQSIREVGKRVDLKIELGNEIKGSDPDSAMYFFQKALELASSFRSEAERDQVAIRVLLGEAAVEIARGNYSLALEKDSIALQLARKIKRKDLEAHTLMSIGNVYYYQAQYEVANHYNYQALELVKQTSDRKLEGKILTNMGVIAFIFGEGHVADSLFHIPLKYSEETDDHDLMAASLLNIGLLNVYRGEIDTAERFFRRSADIYTSINGKDGLILCYQNMANIWVARGDFEKAIHYNMLNLHLSMELGDRLGLSKATHNLGECYLHIGDYEKAMEYYLESLDIKMVLNDKRDIAVTNSSIAHIHYQQGEYNRAIDYYRGALSIYKEVGHAMGIATAQTDIGNIMFELNQLDSAWFYYSRAKDFFLKNDFNNNLAGSYLNISKVHYARKNYVEAERFCNLAAEIHQGMGNNLGLFHVWMMLSTIHLDQSKVSGNATPEGEAHLREALAQARKAYSIAVENKYLPNQKESADRLMAIYSRMGNHREALHYARLTMELADSLGKKQRAEALVNAEIRWNTKHKQEQIERLENEKLLQQQVIRQKSIINNRLYLVMGSLILVVVLVIIVVVLYLKNKEKKKAVEHQKYLNEITSLKMQNINNRLSPHLFFNLLGTVSGQADEPERVKENLTNISTLLRKSLENTEKTAIPLAEELAMVKSYVSLHHSRYPGFFKADFNVAETVDLSTPVPAMMLQIPVENAIKHGLMPKEGEGQLQVTIQKENGHLVIIVQDNGVGRQTSVHRTRGTGTGLKVLLQTIHLINQKNKEKVVFDIRDHEQSGTIVEIKIPDNCVYSL
jgi:tetratricopeptide (TPR) repeat protein